jgi:hypothetical protein
MADEKKRLSGTIPLGGILLLFIGVVLLLQNAHVLPWGLWGTLWKCWPVLIIIFGLGLLLRHVNVWITSLLALVLLFGCLGIAIWQYSPNMPGGIRVAGENYTYPVDGLQSTDAKIEFSGGSMTIGKTGRYSTNLIEVQSTHNGKKFLPATSSGLTMIPDFRADGTIGRFSLKPTNQQSWNSWNVGWNIAFSEAQSLSLNLKNDAAYAVLDMRDMELNRLDWEMNASNGSLTIPVSAKNSVLNIDMNVSNLEITVPDGAAVKIKTDANMSAVSIDKGRFPKQGDYYISPGYDTALNSVSLNISCNVSRLIIK